MSSIELEGRGLQKLSLTKMKQILMYTFKNTLILLPENIGVY